MESSTWMRRIALGVAVACGSLLHIAGASAQTQQCKADGDCSQGYTCQVVGTSACADVACPSGIPCPPPPPCDPVEVKECQPGPCKADSDCAAGMVCFSQTYTGCPTSTQAPCQPGATCVAPAPQPCVAQTEQNCVPRYVPPCKADADCGDGFTCAEQVVAACSGGGSSGSAGTPTPTPGSSGNAPLPSPTPIDSSCTMQSTGMFYCQPNEIACAQDADCPSMWTCGDNLSGPVCSAPSAPAPVPAGTAGAGSTPPIPPSACDTPSPAPSRLCQPPFSDLGFASPGSMGNSGSATTVGAVPSESVSGTKASSSTPAATAGTPSASNAQNSTNSGGSNMPMHVKACSVTAPGSYDETIDGAALLALFAVGLVGLRRRRNA